MLLVVLIFLFGRDHFFSVQESLEISQYKIILVLFVLVDQFPVFFSSAIMMDNAVVDIISKQEHKLGLVHNHENFTKKYY